MDELQPRSRSVVEMIAALRKHVILLHEYAEKVYHEGNVDYAGEIVGKLRLLVTKSRSNTPLLVRLMGETGIEPLIKLGGPPIPLEPGGLVLSGQEISISKYMELPAIGVQVPSGSFVINWLRVLAVSLTP